MQLTTTISILGYIAGVMGATILLFSRVRNENMKDLQERVRILESERAVSEKQHLENQKAISNLEGQLQIVKDIPLRKISSSLEEIVKSNNRILKEVIKG